MGFYKFGNSTHIVAHSKQTPAINLFSFGGKYTTFAYALFYCLSFFCCSTIILMILFSTQIKKEGLNIYFLFILFPDALMSLYGFVELAITQHSMVYPYSDNLCILSSVVYSMYSFTSVWTKALCANELYFLLQRAGETSSRVEIPSSKRIMCKLLVVYLGSCAMVIWYTSDINLTDTRIDPSGCFPAAHSEVGKIINQKILIAISFLLPPIYVWYVIYQIHLKKLLPRETSGRFLITFFLPIGCIVSLSSLLFQVSYTLLSGPVMDLTLLFISSHGLLFSIMTCCKQDIWCALTNRLRIRENDENTTATLPVTSQCSTVGE